MARPFSAAAPVRGSSAASRRRAWPRRHRAGGRAKRRPLSAPNRRSSSPTRWCRAVFSVCRRASVAAVASARACRQRAIRQRREQTRCGRRLVRLSAHPRFGTGLADSARQTTCERSPPRVHIRRGRREGLRPLALQHDRSASALRPCGSKAPRRLAWRLGELRLKCRRIQCFDLGTGGCPTGFEPVLESRSRFRQRSRHVAGCSAPETVRDSNLSMLEVGQGTGKVTYEHVTFQWFTGAPGI
jgi:hypothetical protein